MTLILQYYCLSTLLRMVMKGDGESVDKLVQKAAVEAEGKLAQGSVPQVEMRRENQQQFAATSGVGPETEPVDTEARIVAPAAGIRVGDRVVGSTPENTVKIKKASSVKVSPRRKGSTLHLRTRMGGGVYVLSIFTFLLLSDCARFLLALAQIQLAQTFSVVRGCVRVVIGAPDSIRRCRQILRFSSFRLFSRLSGAHPLVVLSE